VGAGASGSGGPYSGSSASPRYGVGSSVQNYTPNSPVYNPNSPAYYAASPRIFLI